MYLGVEEVALALHELAKRLYLGAEVLVFGLQERARPLCVAVCRRRRGARCGDSACDGRERVEELRGLGLVCLTQRRPPLRCAPPARHELSVRSVSVEHVLTADPALARFL